MEVVAWIIQRQRYGAHEGPAAGSAQDSEELRLGGEMLRLAVAYDTFWLHGLPHAEIVLQLRQAIHTFPGGLLDALETMKPVEQSLKPSRLPVSQLQAAMIVNEDVRNHSGALLVGTGQQISRAMLIKLQEYVENRMIVDEICVLVPSSETTNHLSGGSRFAGERPC